MLGKWVVLSGCVKVWSHYGAEGQHRIEGEEPATKGEKIEAAREMLLLLERYLKRQGNSEMKTPVEAHCLKTRDTWSSS